MSTPNRLTECPTVRVVLFQQADESRGLAAARRFDPADSRRPMPARLGADPGRPAPAAVLETPVTGTTRRAARMYAAGMASVRYAAPARRLFGASYARIPGRARRARRPLSDRMPRRIAADRPHNCRQA
jgi:hypothetical protein